MCQSYKEMQQKIYFNETTYLVKAFHVSVNIVRFFLEINSFKVKSYVFKQCMKNIQSEITTNSLLLDVRNILSY